MPCVKALNTINGITKTEILFTKKNVCDITTIGFDINTYDPCVANKVFNGNQITAVWHFDDHMVRNKRHKIVTRMAKRINKTYEILFEDG